MVQGKKESTTTKLEEIPDKFESRDALKDNDDLSSCGMEFIREGDTLEVCHSPNNPAEVPKQ